VLNELYCKYDDNFESLFDVTQAVLSHFASSVCWVCYIVPFLCSALVVNKPTRSQSATGQLTHWMILILVNSHTVTF